MNNNQFIPDFSGDDLAHNKEVQRSRAEREAYEKTIQESMSVIRQELNAEDSSHINFKDFYMFKPLTATIKNSVKSVINDKNIRISLAEYHSEFPTARDHNSGSDEYLFGYIPLITSYPRTYIHKETLKEKIEDIFLKRDVDFTTSKSFSRRFQVLTENRNLLEKMFLSKSLDNLTNFPEMELEFYNNAALYRSSRKPISIEEAKIFCELTKVLSFIFV